MVKFAINTSNSGEFADPRAVAQLAREAEEYGWDGYFLWDHIGGTSIRKGPYGDSWILLTAIAAATTRLIFGPYITPLPHRFPWVVARQAVTLDHYSSGRFFLGIGSGNDNGKEYTTFGQSADPKTHGEQVDESLAIIVALWSGQVVNFQGTHYHIDEAQFLPIPLQQPRIPIWVAGTWPNKKPFRRAAQWDGVAPISTSGDSSLSIEECREMIAYVRQQRASEGAFDILCIPRPSLDKGERRAIAAEYSDAGVTWLHYGFPRDGNIAEAQAFIRQGPPR